MDAASPERVPIILPYTDSDMAGIHTLYAHYVETSTATFEESVPPLEEMAARRAKVLDNGFPYLVAKDDLGGKVLGYAYANLFHARSAYRFTCENTVYVDHACHGRGIGKALLASLVAQCAARGAKQMVALISGDNPASLALHTGQGFAHAGLLKAVGYKFNTWIDVVYMQRAL